MRRYGLPAIILGCLAVSDVFAAERFFGFNETTSTTFTGVYLAPAGTTTWGPNEALNDKDKTWEPGERLAIKNIARGHFDVKLVDRKGRACTMPGIDLTKDNSFDIRDDDLANCMP